MRFIKLKHRKLNGNISILVILVLLACSLMGILSMNFLNNLISYTDNSYSYYKSYYYAKAGLELALTEIDNSDVGFSHNIPLTDVINNNLGGTGEGFIVSILGRSSFLSNEFWKNTECDDSTALSIPAKGSMTLPMFYDNSSDYNKIFSNSSDYIFLANSRKNLSIINYPGGQYNYPILDIGVVFQSGDNMLRDYIYMTGLEFRSDFFQKYFINFDTMYSYSSPWTENYLSYIVISNPTEDEVNFCIDAGSSNDNNEFPWPTTKYFISSRGQYRGRTVGLQAIYAQPLPSFFINPYVSTSTDESATMLADELYAE